jgi:WhiB family redox-sensing transcriptional regulator
MTWQTLAACRGAGPELFYPDHAGRGCHDAAAVVCATCPVQVACLDHALRHEKTGYWAGTTGRRRITLRRQLGIVLETPQSVFYESERYTVEDEEAVA